MRERRAEFGENRLPEQRRVGLVWIFLRQFREPLIYILLIAGTVSLATGNFSNAIFIFAVVLIDAAIGTFQERRAEASARELEAIVRIRARVQRDGRQREVDSTELVPGDIVRVEAGASVPADIRLLSSEDVRADESLITGESVSVEKNAEADLGEDTPLGDRATMLHAGSAIVSGRAAGVVCRTGRATEVGSIAKSLAESEAPAPPLVLRLRAFTNRIAIVVLVAVAIVAVIELAKGSPPTQIFFLSVALAVSALPAGLPMAVTVALSVAVGRMAKRNVIVRQLPAVEGLGSCTLVASDKTGTLTENKLTITHLRLGDGHEYGVTGEGFDPEGAVTRNGDRVTGDDEERVRALAVTGALANDGEFEVRDGEAQHRGDPSDVAFLVLAAKLGVSRDGALEKHPQVGFVPFASERRFAASFNRHDGGVHAHVKGAAAALLDMCQDMDRDAVLREESRLAEAGYRVLGTASGPVDERAEGAYGADVLRGLTFLGLAGLIDPIRPEVPDAVARCHSAGVDVRMITGDHPATGMAIARRLGIARDGDRAATGKDIANLEADDEALRERIREARVFARIEPIQKTAVVGGLERDGHLVAVTGDGVNDAPALRMAHIGVAMGRAGTDVSRGAADLILTDDNFASIVNGIEEGRVAYDNVRKVIWLLLATGLAEVLLFFLALFVGLPMPLTAIQLLWLNLVTNGVQDVALAFEKGEPGVLQRRPRPPDQPIVDRRMLEETLVSGGYMGLVGFGAWWVLLGPMAMDEFAARNLLLLLMVLFENAHCLSCRSETRSLFRVPLGANPLLIASIVAAQALHIAAMFVPGLSTLLQVEPVSPGAWLTLAPIAFSLLAVDELAKYLRGSDPTR